MKYYIISGEASGDLHGSNLIKALHQQDSKAEIRCWGGNLMQAAGATLVKHYRDLAFMGFAEVVRNLPTIFQNIRFCKEDILQFKPDVLVLIDYPGFNLRIAEWGKSKGFRIAYYISPQVWAWKANRVKKMKQNIDQMLCILPFEKAYYKENWNWDVTYVGHPLVEVIESKIKEPATYPQLTYTSTPNPKSKRSEDPANSGTTNRSEAKIPRITGPKLIALLPGSRKQEIAKKLPIMLEVAKSFPQEVFAVAQAPGLDDAFYTPFLAAYPNVVTVHNQTYDLLLHAKAALVTSGTATLETALFGVPEVVCYKGSSISYQIAKRLIKIKFISLVNLIMDKEVVKELIQDDLTTENLVRELDLLLHDENKRKELTEDYTALKNKLATGGKASAKAAEIIVGMTRH